MSKCFERDDFLVKVDNSKNTYLLVPVVHSLSRAVSNTCCCAPYNFPNPPQVCNSSVWSTVEASIHSNRFRLYQISAECESDIAQDTLSMFHRCFALKETTSGQSWSKWTSLRNAERRIICRCRMQRFCRRGRLSVNQKATCITWELRHRPTKTTFAVPAGSFCDSWASMTTSCNQASAKLFWKKTTRFSAVVLWIKGVVGQKPCYFPTLVLLKQNQHLPKRLGVGRAWMRTHSRPYTATKVAGLEVTWSMATASQKDPTSQFPFAVETSETWDLQQSFNTRLDKHCSEETVTKKVRQAIKKRRLQRGQSSSHPRISFILT